MTIHEIKQQPLTDTPLLLFQCELANGETQRWCTHRVTIDNAAYKPRVIQHNLFEMRSLGEDGTDGLGKIAVRLMDVDGTLTQLERSVGFKGAKLKAQVVFFDLVHGQATTEAVTLFLGLANAPEEMTESAIRLTFVNRMSLQRSYLPSVRIQRRCPWSFPSTQDQREAAVDGSDSYGRWVRCGYSADLPAGIGNLLGGQPFTTCDYSREQCVERGMFDVDSSGRPTRRFGGIEFIPPNILVRGYGENGSHLSYTQENEARFNDVVPLVYGTAWCYPPIIFARNDGNLTHLEILLGMGPVESVERVVANGIEISVGQVGASMSGSGWYNLVSRGERTGAFNLDFTDSQSRPLGDPYGSMAVLSLVLPNRIIESNRLPKVQVLLKGLRLPMFDAAGTATGEQFTNNPAWVLLDVLRRSGWQLDEMDLPSFSRTAEQCSTRVNVLDGQGQVLLAPKFQANLVVRKRTSAAEIVRGLRSGANLLVTFGTNGKLRVRMEGPLAEQQLDKPSGSNSHNTLQGGWPAYEFGDGTDGWGDIVRRTTGEPSLRFWSRGTAELPNRYSLEFQDELNGYQQDSFSLVDTDDAMRAGQEISATLPAIGVPNYRQAAQVVGVQLRKTLYGNLFAEFETSCRGLGLSPGDLITLTYPRLGFSRQVFRVMRVAPGMNFGVVAITAQIHQDDWYLAPVVDAFGGSGQPGQFISGLPRPLLGGEVDETGRMQWTISSEPTDDNTLTVRAVAGFTPAAKPGVTTLRIPTIASTTTVQTQGGSLKGGRTLYYAVSGVDVDGTEGPLSLTVRVNLARDTNNQSVTLHGLSFGPGATGFRVYRGNAVEMLQLIAEQSSIGDSFQDSGLAAQLQAPPDYNYDHANFYWRWESLPPTQARSWTANTIGSDILALTASAYQGQVVRLVKGTGEGQERPIVANTTNSFTVRPAWDVEPDDTTEFAILESSWRLGATTRTSLATWDLPNRQDAFIHVLGRAANVRNQEDNYQLAIQTRWRVSASANPDQGVPPRPVFGLTTQERGTVDLTGIAFSTLANTDSITSGTLALHFVDELDPPTWFTLPADLSDSDLFIAITGLTAAEGNLLQIDQELVVVTSVELSSGRVGISRAEKGTTAVAHQSGTALYLLKRKMVVLPFPANFFGTPASGDYLQTIDLPAARLSEADLLMTNRFGNGETGNALFTETDDRGLRTMSGGQFTLQIDGLLGIQNDAALPVLLDQAYAVRVLYATVEQAPTGAPVQVRVNVNHAEYATLKIPIGATVSDVFDGFGRSPLPRDSRITVDIVSVSSDPAEYPGRDLTILVRV